MITLLDKFFTIKKITSRGTHSEAIIILNSSHEIYRGHFPSIPIVPGACSIQIVKEIAELLLDHKLMLESSDSIKFLSMINPQKTIELKIKMEITADKNNIYTIDTTFISGEEILLKFEGEFQKLE